MLVGLVLTGAVLLDGLHSAGAAETVQEPDLVSEAPTAPELVVTSEGATKGESGTPRYLLRFNGYVHNEGDGALDIRGHRATEGKVQGKTKQQVEEEAKRLGEKNEGLPQKEEEELAKPPMEVEQRLFMPRTPEQEEEANAPEYPKHTQQRIAGTMVYANADGHHHWHLQHVAKYGLYNSNTQGAQEVVPSQKVGFCLEDSERLEETGPKNAVYNDEVRGDFCQLYRPNATSLTEGISPGWRDRYLKNLAWQWVDVSNAAPGEYWLGEEVNPEKFIEEANKQNSIAFASTKTVIPGFVAEGKSVQTGYQQPVGITLSAKAFAVGAGEARYEVIQQPAHGTLSGSGEHLTYTPAAGYSGTDSFKYVTRNAHSEFPRNPVQAQVTVTVGQAPPPAVTISSAPSSLVAGTAGTVQAQTVNPGETVKWSASAGTIVPGAGDTATFTAPSTPGGTVTVTARVAGPPSGEATRTIAISAPPVQSPAPEIPSGTGGGKGGVAGTTTGKPVYLTRPRAMLDGRQLVMSTVPGLPGRVQLLARSGGHVLGVCKTVTAANRRFTCHLRLRSAKLARQKISIVASLRAGDRLLVAVLPAEHLPHLAMTQVRNLGQAAHAASVAGSIFWCSPGTMEEILVGGE
jgi:Lysyl oxidase/Bacterial Ig domain